MSAIGMIVCFLIFAHLYHLAMLDAYGRKDDDNG